MFSFAFILTVLSTSIICEFEQCRSTKRLLFKLSLLCTYLLNRKQCVKNGIEYSNWVTINHGVPQGTVLGPLIFLIYINDFPEKMKKREDVLQFADDTCIICHSKSDENLLCEINSVFESTDSYMRQNMLTLNRDKTEIVVFSKNGESKN